MKTGLSEEARKTILARVLRAIERNRTPGYHFAGHFLGLSFGAERQGATVVSLDVPPSAIEEAQVDYSSCALLADIAMARGVRTELREVVPIATVHMHLQFTGHHHGPSLQAHGRFEGFLETSVGRQALATVDVLCGKNRVCFGSAAFMPLPAPKGFTLPLPGYALSDEDKPVLPTSELTAKERTIWDRAVAALGAHEGSFLDRFWGFRVAGNADGGRATLENGPHVSNRIGHAQGGLLLGLAAKTALAGLSSNWRLNAITACYASPGEGERLAAEACIMHKGGRTATIRSSVSREDGRLVLDALLTGVRA